MVPFSFLFESSYRFQFLILLPSFIELEESIGGPPVMHCMKEPFFVWLLFCLRSNEYERGINQKIGHEWRSSGPFTLFLVTRGADLINALQREGIYITMLVWPSIKDFEVRSKRRGRDWEQATSFCPFLHGSALLARRNLWFMARDGD